MNVDAQGSADLAGLLATGERAAFHGRPADAVSATPPVTPTSTVKTASALQRRRQSALTTTSSADTVPSDRIVRHRSREPPPPPSGWQCIARPVRAGEDDRGPPSLAHPAGSPRRLGQGPPLGGAVLPAGAEATTRPSQPKIAVLRW